ncbi:MAG: hypothetical protein ABR570_17325 [Burkholderiales bacterium]
MKALMIIAAALALGGCHRDEASAGAAKGGSSMQTPSGAATGQASEGSTDKSNAPARPSSPTSGR